MRELTSTFGVAIGDRFGQPPTQVMHEVAQLLDQHHLVCVEGVAWSEREQIQATAVLGTLIGTARRGSVVPNVRVERGADRYADRWHADLSWSTAPAVSVLLCIEADEAPEPTEFTTTTSVAAGLSPSERSRLEGRRVLHDLAESRRRRPASIQDPAPGRGRSLAGKLSRWIARRRPHAGVLLPTSGPNGQTDHVLIDTCPRTGVEFIRLGDHAWSISGMDPDDAEAIVSELRVAVDRAPSWSAPWSEGMLVVYDNRMVLHRRAGVAGQYPGRVLRRTMAEWLGPSRS